MFRIGLLLQLIACYFSEGFFQADEHFQVLEWARAKLDPAFGVELAWEFDAKIRSNFLPFIWTQVFSFLRLFGIENPFFLAFVARLISAMLGVWASLKLYRYFSKHHFSSQLQAKTALALSWALFFLPFFRARVSGENWGGAFFALGWVFLQERRFIWAGALLAFAFESRFQVGLLIVPLLVFECYQFFKAKTYRNFALLIGAMGFVFLLGRCIDYWGYGTWTLSPWNYFSRNLLEGEAARHGVSSIWSYFKDLLLILPPLGAILAFLFFHGLIKIKNLALICSVFLFLLVHHLIAHKEFRFLFPLLYFVPVLAVIGWNLNFASRAKLLIFRALLGLNSVALLFLSLGPAKTEIALYRQVYNLNPFRATFTYSHIGDDPLRYAGLRPHFYLPFLLESQRLEKIEDFNSGILILSESNIEQAAYKKVIFESNCELLWSDLFFKFRSVPMFEKILRATRYRYQLLLRCE